MTAWQVDTATSQSQFAPMTNGHDPDPDDFAPGHPDGNDPEPSRSNSLQGTGSPRASSRHGRIHKWVTITLQSILVVGATLAVLQERWLPAITALTIVALTIVPFAVGRRFDIAVPPEFEALAVVFIYASLFLGEVRGYYIRFWWWDALLHTGSGFLLGITGFLLVHILNEHEDIELHMKPRFVALFAFMFAMGMGALWEIFEFGMDQLFGLNMQKTGLVDTMWDLIVDGVGALAISTFGWAYLRTAGTDSFLERWIDRFIESNPRMFTRS